ncbi:unnamed protein product, partial [Brassica oleracea var. botrytis]
MKGNQKGVPNERRRQSLRIQKPDSVAKRPEPRVHKSSKKSKKSRPVRAQSVESLSASDESEREGSEREVYIFYSFSTSKAVSSPRKITISDVQQKMLSMPPCPDR